MDIVFFIAQILLIVILANFAVYILIPAIKSSKSINDFPKQFRIQINDKKTRDEMKLNLIDYKNNFPRFVPYVSFFVSFFLSPYLSSVKNVTELFILTLTVVLVYATFSLLSFTYATVLANGRDTDLIREEILDDKYQKQAIKNKRYAATSIYGDSIKILKETNHFDEDTGQRLIKLTEKIKKIKDNKEKTKWMSAYINFRLKQSYKHEMLMKKCGEIFLMATILSTISFSLIYGYLIFSNIPIETFSYPGVTFDSVMFIINNPTSQKVFLSLYYTIAAFLLVYAVLNFLRGLLITVLFLRGKFYKSYI